MASAKSIEARDEARRRLDEGARAQRLDWGIPLLGLVFLAGAYWDGWAHNHIPNLIESFFTPYHLLLYAGFTVTALFIVAHWLQGLWAGLSWRGALPAGYNGALIGVVIFAAAGAGDFLWHELFGFEEDVEALLSPSHLLLVTGGLLIGLAPIRAAWQRQTGRRPGGRAILPIILATFSAFSLLTFITQYTHFADSSLLVGSPFNGLQDFLFSVQGIYAFALPLWLLTGMLFFLLRRWQLPLGSVTLIGLTNYGLMYWMQGGASLTPATLGSALLGFLLADGLLWWLRPSSTRVWQSRLFGFALPAALTFLHLLALLLTSNVWWRIHMWAGVPIVIGAGGLFLSYLFCPPALPNQLE